MTTVQSDGSTIIPPDGPLIRECIELLSVDLLDQQRDLVEELKKLAASLRLEFGWHYLLDLTWVISRLGPVEGKRIIDAGAGTGILQWYLAEHGAQVVSVDRSSRALLPVRFRKRFYVTGIRSGDLSPVSQVLQHDLKPPGSLKSRLYRLSHDIRDLAERRSSPGTVTIYNQDLADLAEFSDNSIDAIVSISALEHNTQENLPLVVNELMRVLKSSAPLLATLTAGRDADTWHVPSSGWCYTGKTLQRLFDLPSERSLLREDIFDNYTNYDQINDALRNCTELRDNLARFYFQSDQNGMPWGIWDPQYIPVGVCKVKQK